MLTYADICPPSCFGCGAEQADALPQFIRNYMITKYGLKSIALTNLDTLIKTSLKHAQTDVRVQLFAISGNLLVSAVPERQLVAPEVPQSSALVRRSGSQR